ncbi:hypothetical protein QBC39DRAFT_265191 [Podospora conica]|nr:hypothetical protein QBC39DRAFT_265191 [Schizothecium conicum]
MLKANHQPVKTNYESQPVSIPADFLLTAPTPAVTITPIDFASTPLPEYRGRYAVVLDNVLSPDECAALIGLAESSVAPAAHGEGGAAWSPAMVNIGAGFEVLTPHYRNSDRIIWDHQELVDRLWARCLLAPGLGERLALIQDEEGITGKGRRAWLPPPTMKFARVNERMRFLKYGKGQFFRPHTDAPFGETVDGKEFLTLFTIQLYLNDSQGAVGEGPELIGGSTPFLSRDESRRVDVHPKAGRVLIFQHLGLLHSGDDVVEGTKYTMRTDILYERIDEPEVGEQ